MPRSAAPAQSSWLETGSPPFWPDPQPPPKAKPPAARSSRPVSVPRYCSSALIQGVQRRRAGEEESTRGLPGERLRLLHDRCHRHGDICRVRARSQMADDLRARDGNPVRSRLRRPRSPRPWSDQASSPWFTSRSGCCLAYLAKLLWGGFRLRRNPDDRRAHGCRTPPPASTARYPSRKLGYVNVNPVERRRALEIRLSPAACRPVASP